MSTYIHDAKGKAKENSYFRQVIAHSDKTQVVLMSLLPGEDIGMEVHPNEDQVLYCVAGSGKCVLDGVEHSFEKGDVVLVSAGTEHNFINGDDEPMKIITTYSPPHHKDGTVHKTKADAEAAEAAEHGHE